MTPMDIANRNQEVPPMPLVDCPLCDAPAPFDMDAGTLDCPSCSVRLAVAAEVTQELAAAA